MKKKKSTTLLINERERFFLRWKEVVFIVFVAWINFQVLGWLTSTIMNSTASCTHVSVNITAVRYTKRSHFNKISVKNRQILFLRKFSIRQWFTYFETTASREFSVPSRIPKIHRVKMSTCYCITGRFRVHSSSAGRAGGDGWWGQPRSTAISAGTTSTTAAARAPCAPCSWMQARAHAHDEAERCPRVLATPRPPPPRPM